jgi:hypothetical protein
MKEKPTTAWIGLVFAACLASGQPAPIDDSVLKNTGKTARIADLRLPSGRNTL